MKAWVLHDIGDLRQEDVAIPNIKEKEVLVAVKAAGICGSDIDRIYYTGAHKMPLIPGHEFAGEVVQVGKNVDISWIGKRVGVFPLIPCKECEPCRKKMYEMCRNYSYIGSRQDGAFAEYTVVPEWNLIQLKENISYEAAAMLEPMAVAVHAMRRVNPQKEEMIVICGLGTIGILLLKFLLDLGMEHIYVIGNKEFQKDIIINMGLDEKRFCNSRKQDAEQWVFEQTSGSGTDLFFECVGRNVVVELATKVTKFSGKICLIGNPHGDMTLTREAYWKILRNQLIVTGTWNSSFTHEDTDDWNYVINRLSEGRINPEELITQKIQWDNFKNQVSVMEKKEEDYIKVLIRN